MIVTIIVDVPRYGLAAIDEDNSFAQYQVVGRIYSAEAAAPRADRAIQTRLLIEVQRRLGGYTLRAMLGGQFTTDDSFETKYEVQFGQAWDESREPNCASILGTRSYVSDLPAEFSEAVLEGITTASEVQLPAGILAVDRAAFDVVDSSAAIFRQAAALLRAVIAAKLLGADIEAAARSAIERWNG